jgi:hypothetical protein
MSGFASTSFPALGTTAVVVAGTEDLDAAVLAVGSVLDDIDRTCSRFRRDSDVSRVNDAGGSWTTVDELLVEAVEVALRAASITGGLVDPTVGGSMLRIGYDRDFAEIPSDGPALPTEASSLELPPAAVIPAVPVPPPLPELPPGPVLLSATAPGGSPPHDEARKKLMATKKPMKVTVCLSFVTTMPPSAAESGRR